MPLTVDLKPNESLQIGDATVTFVQKSGQVARLVIEADKSVPVKKLSDTSPMHLVAKHGLMIGA